MNTHSHNLPHFLQRLLILGSLLAATTTSHSATFLISPATSLFTPSFRGSANANYFAWANGTWDGNTPPNPGDLDITPDVINGTPSINPGNGMVLTQAVAGDIISGSNNIYSSVSTINTLGLSLQIPTNNTLSLSGYTTIIIQGYGLNGAMFGAGALDGFGFGEIAGVQPEYLLAANASSKGQWWAKWEIPDTRPNYTVAITGAQYGALPLAVSVTDMTVDTWYSATGFSPDVAAIPEPSSIVLLGLGALAITQTRRRNS